jgi:transposase
MDVLEGARAELKAIVKRQVREIKEELPHLRDRRILVEGEGWHFREVAQHFRCSERHVIKLRKAAREPQREYEFGRPVVVVEIDRAAQARELRAQNVSTRDIARRLGVHQTQVMRWTGKQAA